MKETDSPAWLSGSLLRVLKVGDSVIYRYLKQGSQFRKALWMQVGAELLFTLLAHICKLSHSHSGCRALELMEDPAAFLDLVIGESGFEGLQLVPSLQGKVMHNRKQKTGLAGRHGIELGVIKKRHGRKYTLLEAPGKEQGGGQLDACSPVPRYLCRKGWW